MTEIQTILRPVQISAGRATLEGDLTVPSGANGLVIFVPGSGSGRLSRRNALVAERLQREGLATLLLDLLTREEDSRDRETAEFRFDVPLLSARVIAAVEWAVRFPSTAGLPIGLFSASTGAGAALSAAASRPGVIRAIVSRGGRPDFAGRRLGMVKAATLLIVGGRDHRVLLVNRQACDQLVCERHLEIIQGATHLFDEPGALDEVARLAGAWFTHCLSGLAVRSA
jgi:dienelactone hydrolase